MPRLREETVAKLLRRLEAAEDYLGRVLGIRCGELPATEVEEVAARLDACEDWVTLDLIDWSRLRAILLPEEGDQKSFRRYAAETLAQWSRLCAVLAPESFAARATPEDSAGTQHLPGSHEKVCVMEARAAMGLPVFDSRDARIGDEHGMVAEQGSNGTKDARSIDGKAAKRFLVLMRGENKTVMGKDVPSDDPNWYKMRIPTQHQSEKEVAPVSSVSVSVPALYSKGTETETAERATKQGNPKRARKRKAVDASGWLPFFESAEVA